MSRPAGSPSSLNLRQPLFDSTGLKHQVAFWSASQLLTSSRGRLYLWDAREARCLVQGLEHLTLSNARLSSVPATAFEPVPEAARQSWRESTSLIDRLRTASRSSSGATSGPTPGQLPL